MNRIFDLHKGVSQVPDVLMVAFSLFIDTYTIWQMSPEARAWHHAFNHDVALGPTLAPRLAGLSGQANFYPTGVELHNPAWMCCILAPCHGT